ncbi:branched-chain alpha-keto acid dehydrogenase subunit E2 [Halalkalicoccus paucihalophilus]|uniref:Branched-chain alpha-keto acid dehydrogenase subunit E2 n=1 Tax=Halalkalicoccus paucihalophilus TaxID=1008153 RepID=A0A151ABQ7_9EURY|nr:E3 binding domain-containing protein [Halalkalicoccus paucihalophilus]KYH25118.1 branched-chain alpha-keto acid dehydrogenase subunit E2 [Halalkalicoccus paucihalophilus]
MGYVVKMPKLGLEMEQGTLLEWYSEEGDPVEEGEVLAEIESEKSIGEIEAREGGVLRLVDIDEGETVPPGTPIGIVADADEDITGFEAEFDQAAADPEESTEPVDEPAESAEPTAEAETAASASSAESASAQVKASPRAERRAEELDVTLSTVDGTGPQGAITEEDVEAVAASGETEAETTPAPAAERVKASPRSKRRAEELGVDLAGIDGSGPGGAITEDDVEAAAEETPTDAVESAVSDAGRAGVGPGRYRTATLVVDGGAADTLIETTELAAEAFDIEVSPLDTLLVATSSALENHPTFNATFEDDTHHLHRQQDVALAAEADGELLTPVVEGVEGRSFADLVETRHVKTDEAVASGVSGTRATFALALEGEFDGDGESLLAPPTVAGLLADASRRRATPAENGVSLDRCLSLSLAYDTRVLGDGDAEEFLETLLERIGDLPELVLATYGK